MKERRKDTVFRGETYRKHLGDGLRVVRPSTLEQIARIREDAETFVREAKLAPGELRAEVLADTGEKAELSAATFAELWEALPALLLAPEARWLELSIHWPGSPEAITFRASNEARNLARTSFSEDGQRLLASEAIPCPLPPGVAIPAADPARLAGWLSELRARFSKPLPLELFDSFYCAEELARRGVRDLETFEAHIRETEEEARWQARLVNQDGKEVWSETSGDAEALREKLGARWKPEEGQRAELSFVPRELRPREHPAAIPALRLRADVIRALDLIEGQGADSPEARALELGVRIATTLAEIQTITRAPLALRNPTRKRRGKGKEKHEAKTGKTGHLREEIRRIVREYRDAGNPLKPSEILLRLKRTCETDADTIRHPKDAEALKVSHLRKTVIPAIRKEISEE
jgi:hypothetical protein